MGFECFDFKYRARFIIFFISKVRCCIICFIEVVFYSILTSWFYYSRNLRAIWIRKLDNLRASKNKELFVSGIDFLFSLNLSYFILLRLLS
jgi:hypothetical protein